jgi:LAO/AO transport system kinase
MRVAVLAVDPSSRRSGGALLGDRARIGGSPDDRNLFVRSVAARDQLGGLAEIAMPILVLFRALYDVVLIETVGVGQSETEVADLADIVVFCAQPASGDALQFMKAGVAEIPDIVVVSKADLGEPARRAAADLTGALSLALRSAPPPPVLLVSAREGLGVEGLADEAGRQALGLIRDRKAQGEAHLRRTLLARFGSEGLASLGARVKILEAESPFDAAARLSQGLRDRLSKI